MCIIRVEKRIGTIFDWNTNKHVDMQICSSEKDNLIKSSSILSYIYIDCNL